MPRKKKLVGNLSARVFEAWEAEVDILVDERNALNPASAARRTDVVRDAIRIGLDVMQGRRAGGPSQPADDGTEPGESGTRPSYSALRYEELMTLYEAGALGLTQQQRSVRFRELMAPARARVDDYTRRLSGQISATGGTVSAAEANRPARERQRLLLQAEEAAQRLIEEEHRSLTREQRQELERLAALLGR